RKKAEELIRFQALLVDSTSQAIIATALTPEGQFITRVWNKGAETLYGWRSEEVIGKPTRDFLQPEFPGPGTGEEYRRQFLEKGYWTGEIIQTRKNGSKVVVLTSHTALRDENGKITGAVGIHQDISELKGLQERLAVQERLAYLGRMAGTIAHEVRNPLATVDASAFYLEMTLRDAEGKTKEHLRRMRGGVTRATNIIEKLLEMSRMREPVLRPLDIAGFMANAVSENNIPGNIQVILEKPAEKIDVLADSEQLRMAVNNLVRNAVEAMGQGGTLTVNISKVGSWSEVSVGDTGPGIPAQNMARLFEPLFTIKSGGVGFGLALARTVVEKHGGKIEVKSDPGKGATFVIRLSLHKEGMAEVG
ncbi:MAG: PAS domain S-box protein, partial [Chloroflexi bacterium]|nr:PAS domain S-box protein [Chloroflexota bacterium]